jgi:Ca-activated chloride channel family protein
MDKSGRRKLIVLVTDGEDLEKSGVGIARNLATNGVVVFTIGVGTPAGKEIQIVNQAGQTEFLRDTKNEIVRSKLDETTLREIAEATGGNYYPLGLVGDGLMKVRPAVQALDATAATRQSVQNGVERFYLPLAIMLVLIVGESLIGTRRKIFQP